MPIESLQYKLDMFAVLMKIFRRDTDKAVVYNNKVPYATKIENVN